MFLLLSVTNKAEILLEFFYDATLLNMQDGVCCIHNAPVKLFGAHPPGQPRGQRKNVCDKKGGALENEVKKGRGNGK